MLLLLLSLLLVHELEFGLYFLSGWQISKNLESVSRPSFNPREYDPHFRWTKLVISQLEMPHLERKFMGFKHTEFLETTLF